MITNKIVRKINDTLMMVWFIVLPIIITVLIIVAAYEYHIICNEELALSLFKTDAIIALIFLFFWLVNLIWSFISWIAEKIHFYRLDKFYKEHPEEEQKNKEALAKDFEELAKIIREGSESDKDNG